MRVLSVDIGWRHLAYASLDVNEGGFEIDAWEIVDIIADDAINVNECTMEELTRLSAKRLYEVIEEWASLKPDVVYLENQPLGQMARNVKTKTLSHIMQALLIAKGFSVLFISPKKKLKGMEAVGSYGDNKKFAVAAASKLLEDCGLIDWKAKFDSRAGKRDDLADALLQGYYTAREVKKPKKPRTKRQKRDAHKETEMVVQDELK